MIYPTINSLTKGKFNRYQLAIAASKCARMITDEYIAQRHEADKISTGNKEIDRANAEAIVNREYRDVKAVKLAIDRIEDGEYVIVDKSETGISTDSETKADWDSRVAAEPSVAK
ncbi:MAG: DNA-directed RNA polymerase subunit omega [Clostridia bacterium]|nr:DNA-directed RNA polymerase subunit omega [Clostridia bacterium]MBQ7591900.1 DNA-directed RNA polymerase subunit omega [Clostridia bacterium]